MNHSISLTSEINKELTEHLLRRPGKEDLCFAIWHPSSGRTRYTALIREVVLPGHGDRVLHEVGNVSVTPDYFDRALGEAMEKGGGLIFMHSHPGPGWQHMSPDDVDTEKSMAAQAKAATGFPLVGMTIGTDKSWSGRFWHKTAPSMYERTWCESVRVIGEEGLQVTYTKELLPPPDYREELRRTISVWGLEKQQDLARLKIGVVGLGSVGSIVAETLARMGIQNIKLIDFDIVERHNLDRLLHATRYDYLLRRRKVNVISKALRKNATAKKVTITEVPYSITDEEGFREALDCDVLFSCVDRPWARYILNLIAYAHLIPIVDGGIAVHTKKNGALRGADWQAHIAAPAKRCLECLGQYDSGYIEMERRGDLDDPNYIQTLPKDHALKQNENVFPFSANLASLQVLKMLSMAIAPLGQSDVGTQHYHFVTGIMDIDETGSCEPYCTYPSLVALGDNCGIEATGKHPKAEEIRMLLGQSKMKYFIKRLWSMMPNRSSPN